MPTVIGLFKRYEDADAAVRALERAGVSRDRLQLAARKHAVQRRLDITGDKAVLGLGGLLVGLTALSLVGVGPIFASGAVTSAKAGTGLALIGGGLSAAFLAWGLNRDEAQDYAGGVARGGIVLAVEVDSAGTDKIKEILRAAKAVRTGLGRIHTGTADTEADKPTWAPAWSPTRDITSGTAMHFQAVN